MEGHSWFSSYLTDRTQFVQIDGTNSSVRSLRYGVPQGSVLGPILYLLYTSPLGDIIRKHDMSFHLYADDTQLYTTFRCNKDDVQISSTVCRIERCLEDIIRWMTANKLKLNTDKTELLILKSKFRPSPSLPFIKVGDDNIQPTESTRNIGVIFDSTMSMCAHINNVVKVAFYHLRNIAKIRKYIGSDATEILIHSFVTSKLDFCNSLLYGLPKNNIEKLQRVQNAAARLITGIGKYDHISTTLRELHWLPIEYRIIFKINLMTFKILHNTAPKYLKQLLHNYRPTRCLRSSSDKWILTQQRFNQKTYGSRKFSVAAPTLWNQLPTQIRAIDNINTFKAKLKTYLFKIAYAL